MTAAQHASDVEHPLDVVPTHGLTVPVSTECPASVLRTHDHVTLYLDEASGPDVAR